MSLTDLQDIQRQRNFDTQGNWERSQAHREQITAKLLERDSEALLRVFGAGNSNDLDLKQLSRHYTQIELVDIDSEALAYGFQSQGISDKDGVELLADVDLSGHQFHHTRPASTTVSAFMARASPVCNSLSTPEGPRSPLESGALPRRKLA